MLMPLILSLALSAAPAEGGHRWFTDVTEGSGIPALRYSEGVNILDLDGDGLPEMFLPDVKGPDRLFKNLGGFRFRETTSARGIKEKGGIGAVLADFDGDGLADLYVVRGAYPYGLNVLYRQGGDGVFRDVTGEAGASGGRNGITAAVADFDGDGLPDVFVSNWGRDTLYMNRSVPGRTRFVDATDGSGLADEGRSWGALVCDFDGDGRPDIFVCRGGSGKGGPSKLYMNKGGGVFRDMTAESGIKGVSWAMGAVAADFDGDGSLDIFLTDYDGPDRLFLNDGHGRFSDVTERSGITSGRSIGAAAGDIDGDLLPDLVVAGYRGPARLYRNLGGGRFEEVKEDSGLGPYSKNEAVALADVDGDGALDLYVANYDGHNRLYRNNLRGGNYIKVRPVDGKRPAVGAVVRLYKAGGMGRKEALLASEAVQSGWGFCSQSPAEALFRLPDVGPYDIEVSFPGGAASRLPSAGPGVYEMKKADR